MFLSLRARLLATGALLLALGGCAKPYDVELSMPSVALDTTNPTLPLLAAALPKNPGANTFRLTWSVTPDPKRPLESLAHVLTYDRRAKTLGVHRDQATYQLYSGVSDAAIQKVAAQKGAAADLLKAGCSVKSLPDK